MTVPARSDRDTRLESLDGLRGVAAIIVVFFHVALVSPELAEIALGEAPDTRWGAALAAPPLRLLWSGDEAVIIFFALSGLVLTLPMLGSRMRGASFFARRFIRLYIPVWGAVAFASVMWLAIPPHSDPDWSWWMNAHDVDLNVRALGADLTLVVATSWVNSPLWSLRWEVWFTILFPLLLVAIVRWRRFAAAKAVILLVLIQVGVVIGSDALVYLPVFGLGMILALALPWLRAFAPGHPLVMALGFVLTLVLLQHRWLLGGQVWLPSLVALGAVLMVALFAVWTPLQRFGTLRPVLWLGKISFSLYLVHDPIVVSTAILFGPTDPLLVLVIAVPVSIAVAWAFNLLVEVPSHRLARTVGRYIDGVAERREHRVARPVPRDQGAVGEDAETEPQDSRRVGQVGARDELADESGDEDPEHRSIATDARGLEHDGR